MINGELLQKIKEKITKRNIIIGLVFVSIILVVLVFRTVSGNKKLKPNLIPVVRGNIYQEIFESGQVVLGEKINLSSRSSARVEEIYVELGEEVIAGQELIKLETTNLEIQLDQARISLEQAQLNLRKLLDGASADEIEIARNQLENAQISLNVSQENLKGDYKSALVSLNNSYPQTYNALNFVRKLINQYITIYDEDARDIILTRDLIEEASQEIKDSLDEEDIEQALLVSEKAFKNIFNGLERIREIINDSNFIRISLDDKIMLDEVKLSINASLGSLVSHQQILSSRKLNLKAAQVSFEEAENRLSLLTRRSPQIDIDLFQNQVKQAQKQVQFYENEIRQSKIISPLNGRVVEIKKRIGELAQPSPQDVLIVVLPLGPFEVKVDIYEEDINKIDIGNLVEITLASFSDQVFSGRVISLNPSEKIINDVVYYETTLSFESLVEGIRPGMTADVVILTSPKNNVLLIPRSALLKKEGKNIVQVKKENSLEEREVVLGIKGANDLVEVISGVEEGDLIAD